ncbi:MAG: selenocysteine-specific translation elongation factor [Candidatus Xenobia bacterium]
MERASYILGTAGHVDHGKTTLIKALTGIDTDRLPEEKARGLSIDLGFAHLKLPSGREVGIVDVPGHERFLKNMLAGVGGYDLAMLVIDCIEGIKPQTREHLEILQMLAIQSGVVALTKVDMQDPEYLPLVREDISNYLAATFLKDAPIINVSSITGQGLDELKSTIDGLLDKVKPRSLDVPFRLPVDRVFVKPGFGTVITGSLWQGRMQKGDRVEIQPQGLETRIRGLQVFGESRDVAIAGQRVAVNLAGVESVAIHRGHVLSAPGSLKPSTAMDLQIELLPHAPRPLKHRSWVRMYMGTQEVVGKLILLEADEIAPGSSGTAQILLEEPAIAQRFDRFVLRNITAQHTVGGGQILDTDPPQHRRKDERTAEILLYKGEGEQVNLVMAQFLQAPQKLFTVNELAQALKQPREDVEKLLASLLATHEVGTVHEGRNWLLGSTWKQLSNRMLEILRGLSKAGAHRGGWRKDELTKMFVGENNKLIEAVLLELVRQGAVREMRGLYATPDHVPSLDANQQKALDRMLAEIKKNEFAPPSLDDLRDGLRIDPKLHRLLVEHLQETARIVYINKEIYFLAETLETVRARVRDFVAKNGAMTPAQARDLLQTTRKYIIPLLEYLDETRFTKRQGDARVLAGV